MTDLVADRPRTTDLRGAAGVPHGFAVLEDPTGRRRRRLRLAARTLATLLTLWVVSLLLGAVGINPVSGLPLGRALRPPTAPPEQKVLPQPSPPTVADLQPALPAGAPRSGPGSVAPSAIPGSGQHASRGSRPAERTPAASTPRSLAVHTMPPAVDGAPAATPAPATGRGRTTTTTTTTSPGRSETAPGQTRTTPPSRGGTSRDTTTTP